MGRRTYFENINRLSERDLGCLTTELLVSFGRFVKYAKGPITTGSIGPFVPTPEKPYTARIVTPFYFNLKWVNDLYIIAFLPNDGTGDNKTFQGNDLTIPKDLKFDYKSERVYPRKKWCESEVFFPLFSLGKDYIQRGFTSLEVLTTNTKTKPSKVVREFNLGVDSKKFASFKYRNIEIEPCFKFTVDGEGDDRFGDPHSIFYDGKISSDRVQVVGFLELPRESAAYGFFKERVSNNK